MRTLVTKEKRIEEITLDNIKDKITNDNIRLVSILTKEQMEQMVYKVGD